MEDLPVPYYKQGQPYRPVSKNERGRKNGYFEVKNTVDIFPRTNGSVRRIFDINLEQSSHIETVCLLGRRKPDDTIKVSVNMDDYYQIRDAEEAEKNPS